MGMSKLMLTILTSTSTLMQENMVYRIGGYVIWSGVIVWLNLYDCLITMSSQHILALWCPLQSQSITG